jgi:hypothetical protein
VLFVVSSSRIVSAYSVEVTDVSVRSGDTLLASSSRPAIQSLYIHGNLSKVQFDAPAVYPISEISLVAIAPGSLDLTITFQHPQDYVIRISVEKESGGIQDLDNFYLSNGEFVLKVRISIAAPPVKTWEFRMPSVKGFSSWFISFGEAFPLWTKLLYIFLGFQFLFVGYQRILYDDQRRRERKLRPLDLGNKAYLSIDVAWKFFLSCIAITAVLMIGEIVVLEILRLVFLATINLPSIWNPFVLLFVAVVTLAVYLLRIVLRYKFDLEPTELD